MKLIPYTAQGLHYSPTHRLICKNFGKVIIVILKIFYNSIFGYIFGNFTGLFKRLTSKEEPLWVSRPYFKYRKNSKAWFVLFFVLLWVSFGLGFNLLLSTDQKQSALLPPFFLLTGLLLLLQLPPYFRRIWVFSDRIEIRFIFHCLKVIPFENIKMILRDKKTLNFADVIYYDQSYGLGSLGGNSSELWQIPPSIFQNLEVKISPSQLHPNLFKDYETIKSSLPEFPIHNIKVNYSLAEKIMSSSLFIFNPFSSIIILDKLFNVNYLNIFFYVIIEFSRVYSKTVIQNLLNKGKEFKKQG